MDEQKKPFDVVSIVILMLLAVANDGAEIFCDLIDFTGVGLGSEALMLPIDGLMDGIFGPWFYIRCGFGAPFIIQLLDCFLEFFGIPGRSICTSVGIIIANNPKLEKGAELLASKFGSKVVGGKLPGKGGVVAPSGENAPKGTSLRSAAPTTPEQEISVSGGAQKTGTGSGEGNQTEEEKEKKVRAEKAEKELEPPEEAPIQTIEEQIENTPQNPTRTTEEDLPPRQARDISSSKTSQPRPKAGPVPIDSIRPGNSDKAEEVKEGLSHPKPLRDITEGNGEGGTPMDTPRN